MSNLAQIYFEKHKHYRVKIIYEKDFICCNDLVFKGKPQNSYKFLILISLTGFELGGNILYAG